MKNFKRITAGLLVAALLATSAPTDVLAEQISSLGGGKTSQNTEQSLSEGAASGVSAEDDTAGTENGDTALDGQSGDGTTSSGGASDADQSGTTDAPQGGASNTDQSGTTDAPQGGASDTDQSGTTDAPQGGASDTDQSGTTDVPQGGTSDTDQSGTTDAPQGGTTDTKQPGESGVNAPTGNGTENADGSADSTDTESQPTENATVTPPAKAPAKAPAAAPQLPDGGIIPEDGMSINLYDAQGTGDGASEELSEAAQAFMAAVDEIRQNETKQQILNNYEAKVKGLQKVDIRNPDSGSWTDYQGARSALEECFAAIKTLYENVPETEIQNSEVAAAKTFWDGKMAECIALGWYGDTEDAQCPFGTAPVPPTPETPTYTKEYYPETSFSLKWLDNKNTYETRPAMDASTLLENFTFYYTISKKDAEGEDRFYTMGVGGELTETTSENRFQEGVEGSGNPITEALVDAVQNVTEGSNDNEWKVSLTTTAEGETLKGLISKWKVSSEEEGEADTEYQVTYYVAQKSNIAGDNDYSYAPIYTEEIETQVDNQGTVLYPLGENSTGLTLPETPTKDFHATMTWLDNKNGYGTRPDTGEGSDQPLPSDCHLVLKRYPFGNPDEVEPVDVAVGEILFNQNVNEEDWDLVVKDLPRFGRDGLPYTYFLEYEEGAEAPDINDEDGSLNNENGEPSRYQSAVKNVGDYANDTNRLYEDGTLENTLKNNTCFTITKNWEDEGNVGGRPSMRIYIYRTVHQSGTDVNEMWNGSPVQGYDHKAVPQKDGEIKVGEISVENGESELDLPMFDAYGCRYIYYAKETGLKNDYVEIINNKGANLADSSRTEIIEAAEARGYVLDNGVLKNKKEKMVTLAPTKIFRADSLQSMDINNTSVEMTLQRRLKNRQEGASAAWETVTQQKKDAQGNLVVDTEGNPVMEDVSCEMTQVFRPENMTYKGEGVTQPQYNEQGWEYEYRWIETKLKVNGIEAESIPVPDDDDNNTVFVWMRGLGATVGDESAVATDVGFNIKWQEDANGNIDYSSVVNNLRGVTQVKAQKKWYIGGLAYDPYTKTLTLENGKELSWKNQEQQDEFKSELENYLNELFNNLNPDYGFPDNWTAGTLFQKIVDTEIEKVRFNVRRDGQQLYRGIRGDSTVFTTDEAEKRKFEADGYNVKEMVLDVHALGDGNDPEPWVHEGQFPRYDDNGREYTYELDEISDPAWNSVWSTYEPLDYKKGTVQTPIQTQTGIGSMTIPELSVTQTNAIGPGKVLRFEVDKTWLDGSDILTRNPVTVGLYEVENTDGNTAITPVKKEDGSNYTLKVDEASNWHQTFQIKQEAGKTVNDYIVLEVSMDAKNAQGVRQPVYVDYRAGQGTVSIGNESELSQGKWADIISKKNRITMDAFNTENDNWDYSFVQNYYSGTIAYSENGKGKDPTGLLKQMYYVYIASSGTSELVAEYTIFNQRTAVVDLDLTKEWHAGRDISKIPDCTFKVQVTGDSVEGEKYLRKTDNKLGLSDKDSAEEITISKGVALASGSDGAIKGSDEKYYLGNSDTSIENNNGSSFVFTYKGNFLKNLPKYDLLGNLLAYEPVEVKIGTVEITDQTKFPVYVENNYYVRSMSQTVTYADQFENNEGTAYNPHRTHDLYAYKAVNSRSASFPLVLNKVWQDDGSDKIKTARPDIYFSIYRTTMSKQKLLDETKTEEGLQGVLDQIGSGTEFVKNYYWSTNGVEVSDWYWKCDIGEQPRYDAVGDPYVYFAIEKMNEPSNVAGYERVYYNGDDFPVGGQADTKLTFDHPYDETSADSTYKTVNGKVGAMSSEPLQTNYNKKILIVMDGADGVASNVNLSEKKEGQRYYSATTVNYLQEYKTLSGSKLWELPDGQNLSLSEMPSFDVSLFALNEKLSDEKVEAARIVREGTPESGYKYKLNIKDSSEIVTETIESVDRVTVKQEKSFEFPSEDFDDGLLGRTVGAHRETDAPRRLPVYDHYGRTVYYYMGETIPDTVHSSNQDIGNAYENADGRNNRLVTMEMTYQIVNVYNPAPPYVKIDVEKYLRSEVEGVSVEDLEAPTIFELHAQASDTAGDPISGTDILVSSVEVTRTANRDADGKVTGITYGLTSKNKVENVTVGEGETIPYAEIKSTKVTENPVPNNHYTLTFNCGVFKINGESKSFQLPYYGPNGKPYIYYVKEVVPEGYKAEKGNLTTTETPGESTGGVTALMEQAADFFGGITRSVGTFFRELTGAETREASTEPVPGVETLTTDNVTLESPKEGTDTTYTGKVEITNTYVADPTEVTVTKKWAGEQRTSVAENYRPNSITLQLYRKTGTNETEEIVTTNYKGQEIESNTIPENDKVKVTVKSTNSEGTGTVNINNQGKITISFPQKVNNSIWTVEVTNLAQYAPNKEPYIYFVKELEDDNTDLEYGNYNHDVTGATATNTLPTVQVKASKVWAIKENSSTTFLNDEELKKDQAGNIPEEVKIFQTLYHLGALPKKITFQVEKFDNDNRSWTDLGSDLQASYTLDETAVFRDDASVMKFLNDIKPGNKVLMFSGLPRYTPNDKRNTEIQYRFVEIMEWEDGTKTKVVLNNTTNADGTVIEFNQSTLSEIDQEEKAPSSFESKLQAMENSTDPKLTNAQYRYTFAFTNTLPVRQLEVHKYWADGTDQDGLRPEPLAITVKRDTNVGTYEFALGKKDVYIDEATKVSDPNHYTDSIYVPMYQNGKSRPGTKGENYSKYTASEPTSIPHYQPLQKDTGKNHETLPDTDKKLYGNLEAALVTDKDNVKQPADPNAIFGGTGAPDSVDIQTDTLKDDSNADVTNNYNKFVLANEQTARKTLNLTASKLWDPVSGVLDAVTKPKSIWLQLQYQTGVDDNGNPIWEPADRICGYTEDFIDAIRELRKADGTYKAVGADGNVTEETTVTWTGVYQYKTGGDEGKQEEIKYRVVELFKNQGINAEVTENSAFAYTWSGGTTWTDGPESNDSLVTNKSTTGTNILKTVPLTITKKWEGVYKDQLMPQSIKFKIQYLKEGTWCPYPGVFETGSNEKGCVVLTANDSWTKTVNLPKTDKANNPIQYAVSEVSITYPNQPDPVKASSGNIVSNLDKTNNTWTGVVGAYDSEVITTWKQDVDGKWKWVAEAENAIVTEAELVVTKVWDDESNRDRKRKDITLNLLRDGVTFVTVKLHVDDKGNFEKVTDENDVVLSTTDKVKFSENSQNEWEVTFKGLPLFKNGANSHSGDFLRDNYSQYSISETIEQEGEVYTPTYKLGNAPYNPDDTDEKKKTFTLEGPTKTVSVSITNTYEPERFDLTAQKTWSDDGNPYGLRPTSVTFQLQYRLDDNENWNPVPEKPVGVDNVFADGKGVYTESGAGSQTISYNKETDGTNVTWNQKAEWKGLRKYALCEITVNDTTTIVEKKAVQYRVVETHLDGKPITGAEDYKTAPVVIQTPTGNAVNAEVVNTLENVTFLTVTKSWADGDNLYLTRPDSIQVKLQYRTSATSNWQDVKSAGVVSLTETGNWTHNFTKLRKDYQYRAVEVSMTYGKEVIEVSDDAVGSYVCTSETENTVTTDDPPVITGTKTTLTNTLQTTELAVHKSWLADESYLDKRAGSVTVKLQRRLAPEEARAGLLARIFGSSGAWKDVYQRSTGADPQRAEAVLDADNGWAYTFAGLPKYDTQRRRYEYRAVETYLTGIVDENGSDPAGVEILYDDDSADTLTVKGELPYRVTHTNTAAETGYQTEIVNELRQAELTVTKKWNDQNNYFGTRPEGLELTGTDQNGKVYEAAKIVWKTLEADGTEGGSWTASVTNLPIFIPGTLTRAEYTVAEKKLSKDGILTEAVPEGYTAATAEDTATAGNGYRAVLENTLDTVELTGTKTWDDYSDHYKVRPETVTLKLKDQRGELLRQPEADWTKKGDVWSYRISGLPKYLAGTDTEAVYTVIEENVKQYKADASEVTADGLKADFVNHLVMPKSGVVLVKYAGRQGGRMLPGAEYTLTYVDVTGKTVYYTGTDEDGRAVWSADSKKAQILTTGEGGSLSVTGLPYGSYQFHEEKAPNGYHLNKEPVGFTVDASNQDKLQCVWQVDKAIEDDDDDDEPVTPGNTPASGIHSPRTGDTSGAGWAVTGMVVSLLGIGLSLMQYRKRRRE